MISFKKRFVHCFWNDELEGKKGFVADTLEELRIYVQNKDKQSLVLITASHNEDYAFTSDDVDENYQFCYYDPLYEMKVAYEEGKIIQYRSKITGKWVDCEHRPLWDDNFINYRIKPEEKYQVVISFGEGGLVIVESVENYRKVFFTGTKEECEEWLENNKDIQTVVNGYFSDKDIMYKEKGVKNDLWKLTEDVPCDWDFDHYEYCIKSEEKKEDKYVPFENTQELIEAWEKKCPANKDRPNGTMPLIWIKEKKNEDAISLIVDFDNYGVSTAYNVIVFIDLFEQYTFADGSICGKRK